MKAVIAVVLALAVAVNAGGYITATSQVHDVALHTPIVHAAPVLAPAAVLHTSSSSSYKIRAPAAKILATPIVSAPVLHAAPVVHAPVAVAHSVPIVHTMSHGVLLH